MRKSKSISIATNIFLYIILSVIFLFSFLPGSGGGLYAAAASSVIVKYENQNVLDDLQGTTINGEKIDLSEYYFDNSKNVEVLAFAEFGYSFNTGNQDDYGLYVYVYNPRGFDFTTNQSLNKISLQCGKNATREKYQLNYLNRSTKKGYEGLFYKFKISLTAAQRSNILQTLDKSARMYDVSEIELCSSDAWNATAYNVANVYTYTGYAAGYGSDFDSEESTLACASKDSVTLSLDVHGAAYRPEGTNGKNNYTQDMLHSVYFSIPNSYINEYGEMTAVHATWLNAKTAPIFVTGNDDVYNALLQYVGTTVPDYSSFRSTCAYGFTSDVAIYNCYAGTFTGETINRLNYIFKAPNKIADINNADHYTLKGSEVLEYIRNYKPGGVIEGNNTDNENGGFGGGGGSERSTSELVAGKYYSELFVGVDDEPTEVNITADDTYSITSQKLTQSFWEKVFNKQGTHFESSETFEDIEAIHAVSNSDIKSKKAETCQNLYIDETYYEDFKAFYDKATSSNETVYLFRYYQSEYVCDEAEEYQYTGTSLQPELHRRLDTNAYVAQEVVSLDFDIIDVTLTKDDVSTVIACVSSPIDIVPDITPPVNTTPDEVPWWQKLLAIAGILFILFVVFKFFEWLSGNGKKGK